MAAYKTLLGAGIQVSESNCSYLCVLKTGAIYTYLTCYRCILISKELHLSCSEKFVIIRKQPILQATNATFEHSACQD